MEKIMYSNIISKIYIFCITFYRKYSCNNKKNIRENHFIKHIVLTTDNLYYPDHTLLSFSITCKKNNKLR